MTTAVESGMLRGRPFGGVICLIKSSLRGATSTIHCSERYVIVKVGDCIIINIYLPRVGFINRELLCDDLFAEIDAWCQRYSDCNIIIADDFYTDLVISVLKRGKAADIDGLTSEHILFSHPVLPVIITRLFQLILLTQHIPLWI